MFSNLKQQILETLLGAITLTIALVVVNYLLLGANFPIRLVAFLVGAYLIGESVIGRLITKLGKV